MTLPRVKTLAAVGLSVLVLAGCGSARPGVAIEVDGRTVSLDRVQALADGVCGGIGPVSAKNGSTLPKAGAQTEAAATLLNDLLADQFADEFDLTTSAAFAEEMRVFKQEAAKQGVPSEHMDAVVDFASSQARLRDVQVQVGRAALLDQGAEQVADEQAQQVGAMLFADWAGERDVEIDPRFGLHMKEGSLVADGDDLTVAVSDVATLASDPSRAGELPSNLRCD